MPNAADCRIAEYTTNATDADCDEDLNGNDNCPHDFNPGQEDFDHDGVGDVCDPDIDQDGCNNAEDQHPENDNAISGQAIYAPTCFGTNDPHTYGPEGGGLDTDDDGILNCADYDDDNDGLCDDNESLSENAALGVPEGGCVGPDPCPLIHKDLSLFCDTFIDCPGAPIWFVQCKFNPGCDEFFVKLLELVNPVPLIARFDEISIVNQSLYLFPTTGLPLQEMGNLLAGIEQGGGGGASASGSAVVNQSLKLFPTAGLPRLEIGNHLAGIGLWSGGGASASGSGSDVALRLELWRKGDPYTGAPDTYVATIAEYLSSEVELGDLSSGAVLRVDLFEPSGSSIQLQSSWGSGGGVDDVPLDSDGDGWPDPFDNCLNVPNDQIDTNGDHYGNRCDADYDNDGTVDADDEATLVLALGDNCDGSFNPDLDSNDDCVIDSTDRALLDEQFDGPPGPSGEICSPGQGAVCPTAVPEPGSFTLLCFGAAGLALLRLHHRRHRNVAGLRGPIHGRAIL